MQHHHPEALRRNMDVMSASLQHHHHHHHRHSAAAPIGIGRVPEAAPAADLVTAQVSQGSILARLDQIDDRLRRLEERRQQNDLLTAPSSESYFAADMRLAANGAADQQQEEHKQVGRSMSSALKEVRLKGTLMERLRLLENRILQVSCELEKGSSSSSASTGASTEETRWLLRPPLSSSDKQGPVVISSRRVVAGPKKFTALERIQNHKPKAKKAKDPKDVQDDAEKKARSMCKEEKRMARTRLYNRWFPVGC